MNRKREKATISKSITKQIMIAIALTGSILFFSACDYQSNSPGQEGTDSSTHWPKWCDRKTDCGDLECLCGVCTKLCSDDEDCISAGLLGSCQESAGRYCSDENAIDVCVVECSTDQECKSDRSGLKCIKGQCIPVTKPSGGSDISDAESLDRDDAAASDSGGVVDSAVARSDSAVARSDSAVARSDSAVARSNSADSGGEDSGSGGDALVDSANAFDTSVDAANVDADSDADMDVDLYDDSGTEDVVNGNDYYTIKVLGRGLDCGDTYIVEFLERKEEVAEIVDSSCCVSGSSGIYYADSLPAEYKVGNIEISIKFRESDVAMVCTMLGPTYHHIIVTDIIE